MDIRDLKEHIYNEDKIINVLESIGMHNIKQHLEYISCSWRDGDNPSGCVIYCNENLNVTPYTRKITKNQNITPDIITLVQFTEELTLFQAIKFICTVVGLDVYDDVSEDIPLGMKFMKELYSLSTEEDEEENNGKIQVRNECILSYYQPYVNDFFKNDGISYYTQKEFEIGYDEYSNMITIPIRDEHGTLVGVKGRLFKEVLEEHDLKYVYLERVPRNKILYGLYMTYEAIIHSGIVYICESEKGVMQLWSMGYCNSIAIGGSHLGREQIEKITRLGVKIVFAFDKDIKLTKDKNSEDEKVTLEDIAERFITGVDIYAIVDTIGILKEKESPMDKEDNWNHLVQECIYKIKRKEGEII